MFKHLEHFAEQDAKKSQSNNDLADHAKVTLHSVVPRGVFLTNALVAGICQQNQKDEVGCRCQTEEKE